jgi:arabinogalactan oligomer / maltooligosaccharide transport system permease protein
MVGWSGRRKVLTILAFIAPMLLALLVFSIYPFIFNGFISLTNRGNYHPNPDCTNTLWRIVEPTCWLSKEARGMATPFRIQQPFYKNYADLLGGFFTGSALLALLRIVIALLPVGVAYYVNRRLDRQVTRSVPSVVVWLAGVAGVVLLGWLLKSQAAVQVLTATGDFIVVNLRTILYVAICIPLFFVVGLTLALLLNNTHLRGRTVFRVILVVPWAASNVALMMSLVWQFFFRQQGTINQLLSQIHIAGPTYLNSGVWAFAVVVLVNLWYSFGFFMVVTLGGLQSIPVDLYEASDVDGASLWQQLTKITLPLLRPAVLPAIVLSSLTTYKVDAVVYAITQGGPSAGAGKSGATDFVMVYAYKQIFQTRAFGTMGAFAVILFVLLFAATLYSMRITQITKGAYE